MPISLQGFPQSLRPYQIAFGGPPTAALAVPGHRVGDGGKGTYLGGLFPDSAQCLPDCLP